MKIRDDIKLRHVGATGKGIVLVEGPNDRDAFGAILDRRYPGWETKWEFEPAHGKRNVTAILAKEPGWMGVIDRDEWSAAAIAEKEVELPGLVVLPRFCLESYAIRPSELWASLPPIQQRRITGGEAQLRSEILVDKEKWLRHGVLRSVINPMWNGLRGLGFQNALLDFATAQDDALIRETLNSWHTFMEPTAVFDEFSSQLTTVVGLPEDEQLCRWVYGKLFFSNRVVPMLNRLLGSRNTDKWRNDIFATLPPPPDLEPLWRKMGLT